MNNILNFLAKFSGDDPRLVAHCSKKAQYIFAGIGLLLIVIFTCTLVSIQIAIESLFKSAVVGYSIGVFFACVLSVLYVLLLYTLTPNVLPHQAPKSVYISRALRVLSIAFLAIIVSKPLEYQVMSKESEEIRQRLRQEQLAASMQTITDIRDHELIFLDEQLAAEDLPLNIRSEYTSRKQNVLEEAKRNEQLAIKLTQDSKYFIKTLEVLNENNPWLWLITSGVALTFLIPIALKISIPRDSQFIANKMDYERNLVTNAFDDFKIKYEKLFFELHHRLIKYPIRYHDAPFNLKPMKKEYKPMKQEELVKLIYKK